MRLDEKDESRFIPQRAISEARARGYPLQGIRRLAVERAFGLGTHDGRTSDL